MVKLAMPSTTSRLDGSLRSSNLSWKVEHDVESRQRPQPSENFWKNGQRSSKGKLRPTRSIAFGQSPTHSGTYATMRLSEGVSVFQLAANMGTSVEMIEKFYGKKRVRDPKAATELTKNGPQERTVETLNR